MNWAKLSSVVVRFPLLLLLPLFGGAQAFSQGQWSALENWPTRAIHTTLLPDGRVLFISYYNESLAPNIWDPATNTFSPTAPAPYALFRAGHKTLADGRVFIAGGHIADYTRYSHALIYDPFLNTMTQVPDMNEGRWYPSTTVLANGDVLVVSGTETTGAAAGAVKSLIADFIGQSPEFFHFMQHFVEDADDVRRLHPLITLVLIQISSLLRFTLLKGRCQ